MPKSCIAVRHVEFEDLGAFAETLEQAGYGIRYCDIGLHDLSAIDPIETDLVVFLGAPIGVYQDDKYPFIRDELALLDERLRAARPTLGICLGAQLMARALGARVYPGRAKEIGWAPVSLTDTARAGPLQHLDGVPVLHWHGDTFDLPDGADLLASTPVCANQAFSHGRNALGFQFHAEVGGHGFELWLIGHAVEIGTVKGLSTVALRADAERYAPSTADRGRRCLEQWLEALEGLGAIANAQPEEMAMP